VKVKYGIAKAKRGFEHGLGQRRMGMRRPSEIVGGRAYLHC
jgi:hypothetical protein